MKATTQVPLPHSSCRLCLAVLVLAAVGAAQTTQRCDLGSPRIAGTDNKDTLDIGRLRGATVNVPSTVTRISRDAFAFYKGNTSVDIVYVLDHSTSMSVDGYWESADGSVVRYIRESPELIRSDTLAFTDCGQRQIPYGGGLSQKIVTRVCGAYHPMLDEIVSGDPFGSGSYAVREAIGEQARLAPHSRAAYLPFDVADMEYAQQALVDLSAAANVNRLFDRVDMARNDFVGTTNYTEPLDKAKQWLQGSANPVIFFITDLRPTENGMAELSAYMQGYAIPVYGVFIGLQEPAAVKDLFEKTGNGRGGFYHISPENSDSLKHILKQFVGDLLAWGPTSGLIENKTNGRTATASGSDAFTQQAGFTVMNTASEVALNEGPNQVRVRVEFTSTDGATEIREATFTVNVGGVPANAYSEDLLGIYCGPATTLTVTNAVGTPVGSLEEADRFGLAFTTGQSHASNSADVVVGTTTDREIRSLTVLNSGTAVSGSQTFGLTIGDGAATPGNGVVEARGGDELTARWEHPFDPRDTAVASARISQAHTIAVTGAVYRDGRGDTADGCIDTVLLYLDQTDVLASGGLDINVVNEWKDLITLGGALAGLRVERIVRLSDTRLNLVIAHNAVLATGDQTLAIASPPVNVEGFLSWAPSNRVKDGIAPVAVDVAQYRLAAAEGGTDTLVVTFSESVDFAGSGAITPFILRHADGEYMLDLELSAKQGASATFLVRAERVRSGGLTADQIPATGDSLSIFVGQVSESGGTNPQTTRINRRVILKVTGEFSWALFAYPNPFDPTWPPPEPLVRASVARGTMIMVQTRTKLSNLSGLTGVLSIYDAVGNLVWTDSNLRNDVQGTYFVWEGINMNRRVVGSDTYLAVVSLTMPDRTEESKRLRVGVGRR